MTKATTRLLRISNVCKRCYSSQVGPTRDDSELVCYECGMVHRRMFEGEVDNMAMYTQKTYKRLFYFNERCKRWCCEEPAIESDILFLLEDEYHAKRESYQPLNKGNISRLLRSVDLLPYYQRKFKSVKFKCNLMNKKRFHDKYFEKWKSIIKILSGVQPLIPSTQLLVTMKRLFKSTQIPFEKFRHQDKCDGRKYCEKYFNCWHNYMNYDWLMRKLLQICEIHFHFKGAFDYFKDDFTLVDKQIRIKKLHPMWKNICRYLGWTYVGYLND